MQTIEECINNKLCFVGSRPGHGKMEYLSKLIKQLMDSNKKITLFALEGSENWYLTYFLSEITGIDKKMIRRYLYPCVFTGKEKGESIDRNCYVEGIEYLQRSNLYIKNYYSINPANINTLNVLELIIEEIKDVYGDVDYVIIDRLDDVINNSGNSRERVLELISEELIFSHVSVIIFDNIKRNRLEKDFLKKDSFVNYELIEKYSDRMIIVYDYEDYLIK